MEEISVLLTSKLETRMSGYTIEALTMISTFKDSTKVGDCLHSGAFEGSHEWKWSCICKAANGNYQEVVNTTMVTTTMKIYTPKESVWREDSVEPCLSHHDTERGRNAVILFSVCPPLAICSEISRHNGIDLLEETFLLISLSNNSWK